MKKSAWLPAVIAPVVVAGAVAAPMIANAASDPIAGTSPTAAAVIASIAQSSDAQYSGKLVQTSDLGLPELPTGSGGSSLEGNASDALGLLTSSHTARIYVDGTDKQKVGEIAAKIRKLRKPDPYKAKGVRYEGEHIRRKVGKAGK